MPDPIRLKRLERLALERAAEVVNYELADPRLGMVTLTRVKLSSDLSWATIHWSCLGGKGARSKVQHALDRSSAVVQKAIADSFQTRRSPRVRFLFDESIAGAIEMDKLFDELREEREEREAEGGDGAGDDSAADESTGADAPDDDPSG
jgi:ribosome-binding factor A